MSASPSRSLTEDGPTRMVLVGMLVFLAYVVYVEMWASGLLEALNEPAFLNATASRELSRGGIKLIPSRCAPLPDVDPDMLWNRSWPSETPPKWKGIELWTLNGTRDREGHRYPFSSELFSRSFYAPDDASRCTWARIGDRLRAGAHASIGVIGGSMTRGTWMRYSWPDVLQAWVRHHLGNISVISAWSVGGGWCTRRTARLLYCIATLLLAQPHVPASPWQMKLLPA